MRRYKALALGFALLAAVLGPGTASAARVAVVDEPVVTGFSCSPSGGGIGDPTTTDSVVTLNDDPSTDLLACDFTLAPTVTVKTSKARSAGQSQATVYFGGPCSYGDVTFSHRIYVIDGGSASLICWGGSSAPV